MKLRLHYKADFMEIKSKQGNFRLREWMLTDGVSLAKHINNVKIWNNVRDGLPYPYTILDADKYIRMVQVLPYVQNFAIEIAGETVGGVGIAPLTDVERLSAEVGYWLGEDYWNRGIMRLLRCWLIMCFGKPKLFVCLPLFTTTIMPR